MVTVLNYHREGILAIPNSEVIPAIAA